MSHTTHSRWDRSAIMGAVSLLVLAIIAFYGIGLTRANNDWSCTEVINPAQTECSNGSWGPWATTETNSDGSTVQERTYTGTEEISQTITYATLNEYCAADYQGAFIYGSWASYQAQSGILPGQESVTTQYQACQITQTQTLAAGGSVGNGGNTPTVTNQSQTEQTTGGVQVSTEILTAGGYHSYYDYLNSMPTTTLKVSPAIVKAGETTQVMWTTKNINTCSITGSDGEVWNLLNSPVNGETSGPIDQQTIFTLNCVGTNGADLMQQATVNVVPNFQEQ